MVAARKIRCRRMSCDRAACRSPLLGCIFSLVDPARTAVPMKLKTTRKGYSFGSSETFVIDTRPTHSRARVMHRQQRTGRRRAIQGSAAPFLRPGRRVVRNVRPEGGDDLVDADRIGPCGAYSPSKAPFDKRRNYAGRFDLVASEFAPWPVASAEASHAPSREERD